MWRKRTVAAAAWFGAALGAWLVAGVFLFVAPVTDDPSPASAVFVLAPATDDRVERAEDMIARGYADTLAVSVPSSTEGIDPGICHEERPYRVLCFAPDPITTQGEGRALRELSNEYGWQSVNVVTANFHVARARIILQRCFAGDLRMVGYEANLSPPSWAYRFTYETAAFVKVAVNPEC